MRVLITRPEEDASDLKSRIEALCCEVVTAPLLEIVASEIAGDALAGATGLIATSRNGLRSLAASSQLHKARHLPLFAVGPATAALARELGFKTVHDGAGTAAELVPLIVESDKKTLQNLVHLAGDHLAFDLAGALKAKGIQIQVVEAYRSVAAKALAAPVPHLLAEGQLDAVILMSPRSAKVWAELTASLPQKADLTRLVHICLSSAVAKGLTTLQPVRVETAARPTSDEIIALVYRLAGPGKTS
jgi:uroporphyrinogen-III synthase